MEATDVDKQCELEEYRDFLEKKVSRHEAVEVIVEGAASSDVIKEILKRMVKNPNFAELYRYKLKKSQQIAQLFVNKLDAKNEETMKQEYIPSLAAFAMCELEIIHNVSYYMFGALLQKTKKKGLDLVKEDNGLSFEVYNRLLGATVCTHFNKSQRIFKLPKPDDLLPRDEFRHILHIDNSRLDNEEAINNWFAMLAYSEDEVKKDVFGQLTAAFPWKEVFTALYPMKEHHTEKKWPGTWRNLIHRWGEVSTSIQERKSVVQALQKSLKRKQFAGFLDTVIDIATFPLDRLHESVEEQSLMAICPTPHVAAKLFRHYVKTADKDVDVDVIISFHIFESEGVSDEKFAAIVREVVAMEMMPKEDKEIKDIVYGFFKRDFILSVAEVLRSGNTPSTHPLVKALHQGIEEPVCYRILTMCNPDLNALDCMFGQSTSLHLAARCGYSKVAKEILLRGYNQLLNRGSIHAVKECENPTNAIRPVTAAVKTAQFSTATLLLKAMEPMNARTLFTTTSRDPKPEINLHHVIEEVRTGRGEKWGEKDGEEGGISPWKMTDDISLNQKEIEERIKFIAIALDKTIDGEKIDLSVLIQDEYGVVPEVFGGSFNEIIPREATAAGRTVGEALYHKIAKRDLEDLKNHESFATLTYMIWINYGVVQGMLFFLYIIFIGFLTTSLVLGAKSSDPSKYSDPVDGFRLFCEVITFLFVIIQDLVLEVYEIAGIVNRKLKCTRVSGDKNRCFMITKEVFVEYFANWQNFLDNLSVVFVFLIIPFRIADSDIQWIFAALAFLFNGLRIFKYAIMFESVGEYVAILILLIKRDVPQFVTVFIVIIFSMGGALYLSLIGYYNDEHIDNDNNNETSEIYLLWVTGFRILAEGSVLTYTGPGGFNWLGVLIYWLFLFIVVVVMLNILIAQFSKSYEEETQNALINVVLTRTDIIVKMDRLIACVRFVQRIRTTLFKRNVDYSSVKRMETFAGKNELGMEEMMTKQTEMDSKLIEMDGKLIEMDSKLKEMQRCVEEIHQKLMSM